MIIIFDFSRSYHVFKLYIEIMLFFVFFSLSLIVVAKSEGLARFFSLHIHTTTSSLSSFSLYKCARARSHWPHNKKGVCRPRARALAKRVSPFSKLKRKFIIIIERLKHMTRKRCSLLFSIISFWSSLGPDFSWYIYFSIHSLFSGLWTDQHPADTRSLCSDAGTVYLLEISSN